ncbi:MAG: tryptophan synthase subunit alpha [Fusobacterium sp.]
MNKLEKKLREKDKNFIGFLTGGDPSIEKLGPMVHALEDGGCDVIEIGVPFSDPLADGPVIQSAGQRAIEKGVCLKSIFSEISKFRKDIQVPLVFLIYYNSIFNYGVKEFVEKCEELGIDGLIIPDLPYEEQDEILEFLDQEKIALIPFATPTSKDRMKKTLSNGSGFVYTVSSLGVTGRDSEIYKDFEEYIKEVKKYSNIPVAVGFGISSQADVKNIYKYVDNVIVGTAIVKKIHQSNGDYETVKNYIKELITL